MYIIIRFSKCTSEQSIANYGIIIRFRGCSIFAELVGSSYRRINVLHELINYGFKNQFSSVGILAYTKLCSHEHVNFKLSTKINDSTVIHLQKMKLSLTEDTNEPHEC